MNIEMAFSPVRADTRKKSLHRPSLMKCLLPLSTQPEAVRRAWVRMPAASEPAPGSVMVIEQVRAPGHRRRSQRSTCGPLQCSKGSYTLPKARRIR
jgi:hypothetical protein